MPTMCIQTAVVRMDVTVGPLNAPHSSALWTRCLLPVNQIFMWRTKHLLAYADVQTNPKLWLHYSSTLMVCLSDSLDAGWGQFTTGLPKCLRLSSLLLPFFFGQNVEDAGSSHAASYSSMETILRECNQKYHHLSELKFSFASRHPSIPSQEGNLCIIGHLWHAENKGQYSFFVSGLQELKWHLG